LGKGAKKQSVQRKCKKEKALAEPNVTAQRPQVVKPSQRLCVHQRTDPAAEGRHARHNTLCCTGRFAKKDKPCA
jgi:hypothetical protein